MITSIIMIVLILLLVILIFMFSTVAVSPLVLQSKIQNDKPPDLYPVIANLPKPPQLTNSERVNNIANHRNIEMYPSMLLQFEILFVSVILLSNVSVYECFCIIRK